MGEGSRGSGILDIVSPHSCPLCQDKYGIDRPDMRFGMLLQDLRRLSIVRRKLEGGVGRWTGVNTSVDSSSFL